MPIALLRRELKGPDFFLVGLFPGMIKDCRRKQEGQWAQDSNLWILWGSPCGLKRETLYRSGLCYSTRNHGLFFLLSVPHSNVLENKRRCFVTWLSGWMWSVCLRVWAWTERDERWTRDLLSFTDRLCSRRGHFVLFKAERWDFYNHCFMTSNERPSKKAFI